MNTDAQDMLLIVMPLFVGFCSMLCGFLLAYIITNTLGIINPLVFLIYPITMVTSFIVGYISHRFNLLIVHKYFKMNRSFNGRG